MRECHRSRTRGSGWLLPLRPGLFWAVAKNYTLVPVWLVGYTYGRKTFQIVANGYTGQIAGERPYSWVKITFAVLAVLLLIMLLAPLFTR